MANLFYTDTESGDIKTLANTDSPEFIGTPTKKTRTTHIDREIINVSEAVSYIDGVVASFNTSRVVSGETYRLNGLAAGKKYLVSVYGKFNSGTSDTYTIGPVVVTDSSGHVLKSSGSIVKNLSNPKCMIPQSASLIIDKVPDNGIIIGLVDFVDNTGTNASYMMAIRLS